MAVFVPGQVCYSGKLVPVPDTYAGLGFGHRTEWIDFDDVRAKVAEEHSRYRTCQPGCEVEHPYTVESSCAAGKRPYLPY